MKATTFLELSPFDTLFLRDGRPFDQLNAGLADASSVFPPLPSTLSGMIALAVARRAAGDAFDPAALGRREDGEYRLWTDSLPSSGDDDRDTAIRARIGRVLNLTGRFDRRDDDAQLQATGPFLFRMEHGQRKLYVPWPSTLLVEKKSRMLRSVAPIASFVPVASEQPGALRPAPHAIGDQKEGLILERVSDGWIEWDAFNRYLGDLNAFEGDTLSDISIGRSDILDTEERIGIAVDPMTGSVEEGALYAASHIRMKSNVSLAMRLDSGSPMQPDLFPARATLGGEGRQVSIVAVDHSMKENRGSGQYKSDRDALRLRIVALTPVPVDATRKAGLPAFSGPEALSKLFAALNVMSAVVERPRAAGLWRANTVSGIRVMPAGSTWFVTVPTKKKNAANAAEQLAEAAESVRLAPPDLAALGYGVFRIGNWP
jgi:CRISPR-associated protein Cmr3